MNDREQIEAVLRTYFDALYEGDPGKIALSFHDCCHLFSVADGKLTDISRHEWMEKIAKRPSPKAAGDPRGDVIVSIDQSGPTTAFAKVRCQLPPRYFTDYLTLTKLESGWRIVSKTFHTEVR